MELQPVWGLSDYLSIFAVFIGVFSAIFSYLQVLEARRVRVNSENTSREQAAEAQRAAEAAIRSAAAAEESAKTSRLMLETGARAWIVVGDVALRGLRSPTIEPFALLKLKNEGRTPAIALGIKILYSIGTEPPAYDSVNRPAKCLTVLGPRLDTEILYELKLLPQHLEAIETSTANLYILGIAYYKDVLSVERETRWCLRYDFRQQGFVPALELTIS